MNTLCYMAETGIVDIAVCLGRCSKNTWLHLSRFFGESKEMGSVLFLFYVKVLVVAIWQAEGA